MRALVVGGGIGGLTAGIALSRVGIEATVFEAATEFQPVGGGLGIGSNAMTALARIGVADAVRDAGEVVTGFDVRTDRGELIFSSPFFSVAQALGAPTIGAHRADLQAALLSELDSSQVRFGHRCAQVSQNGDEVAVRFANGALETGDVAIGADGFDSVVRQQTVGLGAARPTKYIAWVGISPAPRGFLPKGHTIHYWGRGRRFGIIDIGRGRVYWWGTRNMPGLTETVERADKKDVLESYRGWSQPIEEVIETTLEPGVFSFWTRDRKPIRRWSQGRVTLLGDAAHPMLTSLAQGAGAAIEDAVALAQCLTRGGDPRPALREYEDRRAPHTARVVARSRQASNLEQAQGPLAYRLRNRVFRMMPEGTIRRQAEWLLTHRG